MAYIFYISAVRNSAGASRVVLPDGREAFVRVEAFDGNVSDALDAARPLPGESVMNTHVLEDIGM